MRSLPFFALLLVLAAPLVVSTHTAQASPPPTQSSTPPIDCVTPIFLRVPDADRRFARVRLGDEWFSGCLGPAGPCTYTVYVPC